MVLHSIILAGLLLLLLPTKTKASSFSSYHHHPKRSSSSSSSSYYYASMYDYVSHDFESDPSYNSSIDNDAWKSMCEMIEEHENLTCETYYVTTEDGYILQVFRIPPPPPNHHHQQPASPSVLLQHGLEADSFQWLFNEPSQNQAITLSKAGYDVWMGNNRGNHFSTNHTTLNPFSDVDSERYQFWSKMDWDDMGLFDIPAMADFISNKTGNEKISYFGHSQGTTQFFVGASLNPTYYKKRFNFMGALAPIARLKHQKSIPFSLLAPQWSILQSILVDTLGIYDWIHPETWEKLLLEGGCTMPVVEYWCEFIVELIADSNIQVDNLNRRKTFLTHMPAGSSYKSFVHFAQLIKSGKFQRFDYTNNKDVDDDDDDRNNHDQSDDINPMQQEQTSNERNDDDENNNNNQESNNLRYNNYNMNNEKNGSITTTTGTAPEEYPLHQIPTIQDGLHVALFAGTLDVLSDPIDVKWLKDQLGDDRVVFFKEYKLGHLSFSLAKDMSYWTDDAMSLLQQYATIGSTSSSSSSSTTGTSSENDKNFQLPIRDQIK